MLLDWPLEPELLHLDLAVLPRADAPSVTDGAPGCRRRRELGPPADEQRCTVHALRNVTPSRPNATTPRSRRAGEALRPASSPAEARRELERSSPTTAQAFRRRCRDRTRPRTARRTSPLAEPSTANGSGPRTSSSHVRRGAPPHQGDQPVPRRDQRTVAHLGRARALKPRLARRRHDPEDRRRDRTHPASASSPSATTEPRRWSPPRIRTSGATPPKSPGMDATTAAGRGAPARFRTA